MIAMYLMDYFRSIAEWRKVDGFTGNPELTPMSEIVSWQKLYRIELEVWEIEAIHAIDVKFVAAARKRKASKDGT